MFWPQKRSCLIKLLSAITLFRKLAKIIDFNKIVEPLRDACYSNLGQNNIDISKGFKALLVQL